VDQTPSPPLQRTGMSRLFFPPCTFFSSLEQTAPPPFFQKAPASSPPGRIPLIGTGLTMRASRPFFFCRRTPVFPSLVSCCIPGHEVPTPPFPGRLRKVNRPSASSFFLFFRSFSPPKTLHDIFAFFLSAKPSTKGADLFPFFRNWPPLPDIKHLPFFFPLYW